RIFAPDEGEKPLGIALYRIARPDGRAAVDGRWGCCTKALGAPFLILPIAFRHQGSAMHEFARLIIGGDAPVGAADQDFSVGYRAAHRGGMAGDERRVEIG